MNPSRPQYATTISFAVSLVLHLIFFILLVKGSLKFLMPSVAPVIPSRQHILKIVEIAPPLERPKSELQFVPTIPSQKSPQIDPNAILESERDTVLRSHEHGDLDSPMPQLSGPRIPTLDYVDSTANRLVKSQASPPNPPAPQSNTQRPTPEQAKPTNSPSEKPVISQQDSPAPPQNRPPMLDDPHALPILPPDSKSSQPPAKQSPEDPLQAPPPAPPPSIPSAQIQHSHIDGTYRNSDGDVSPSSRETEMGAYKAKLYRTIGSAWYIAVDENQAVLAIGEVKVRFYVRANGTIDELQVTESSGITDVLKPISLNAVRKCEPFDIFSDAMKQQVGMGYWEEITFTIY